MDIKMETETEQRRITETEDDRWQYSIRKMERIFTLHTDHSTYQMKADSYGNLLHLYYGDRTEGSMEYLLTFGDRGFSPNPYEAGDDRNLFPGRPSQEYPYQGSGIQEPCRSGGTG